MNAPTRAEFLARRMAGIGGSDLAAVLGLSPYKTPFQLWQEKTGRFENDFSPAQEERMHWGNVLEDVVARHYADQRTCKVQRINAQMVHRDWPIIIGNVDRVRVIEGSRARWDAQAGRILGADAVLEVKTASAFAAQDKDSWGEPGTDQVPQHYWMQVQHYLGISGLPCADLAVLFGGQQFRVYTIAADAALQRDMFDQASDWWQRHVATDTPPDPSTEAEARLAWATHREGKQTIADMATAERVAELHRVKAQIKALEEEEQLLRDQICCAFGDAEAITWQGRKLASWKANAPSQKTDWKAAYLDLCPTSEHTQQFTTTTPGARVLRLATVKE